MGLGDGFVVTLLFGGKGSPEMRPLAEALLGAAPDDILPDLAQAMFERRRFVAAFEARPDVAAAGSALRGLVGDAFGLQDAREELDGLVDALRERHGGDDEWTQKTAKKLALESSLNPRGRPKKDRS